MKNKRQFSLHPRAAIALTVSLMAFAAFAGPKVTVKLGSLAPKNSPFDTGLRKLAAEWSRISDGAVNVKVYAGGVVGDEEDMIRKMRIGQLDAAGMTGVGLSRIHPCLLAMQLPLLVRTDEEMRYILETTKESFNEELRKKGFTMVLWNHIGWVHFFAKKPVVYPKDLQAQKMFMYAGDPNGAQVWKEMGFHPVPLSPTDVLSSLQSGMVDAFTTSPLAAASYQWFGLAQHMSGMRWAPFLGGVVISARTWKKIPDAYHQSFMETAERIGAEMQREIRSADAQAVQVMKEHGLRVHEPQDDALNEWKEVVSQGFKKFIGSTFDERCYKDVKKRLFEYRNRAAGGN